MEISYFSNSIGKWFHTALKEELIQFYKYYDFVINSLIPDYNGIYINEQTGALSEDSMSDFNWWIIAQGFDLWKAAAKSAKERNNLQNTRSEIVEKQWADLYNIHCENEFKNSTQTWQGTIWEPIYAYFTEVERANYIFEERFGTLLSDEI
jgi:hypothetical protein